MDRDAGIWRNRNDNIFTMKVILTIAGILIGCNLFAQVYISSSVAGVSLDDGIVLLTAGTGVEYRGDWWAVAATASIGQRDGDLIWQLSSSVSGFQEVQNNWFMESGIGMGWYDGKTVAGPNMQFTILAVKKWEKRLLKFGPIGGVIWRNRMGDSGTGYFGLNIQYNFKI